MVGQFLVRILVIVIACNKVSNVSAGLEKDLKYLRLRVESLREKDKVSLWTKYHTSFCGPREVPAEDPNRYRCYLRVLSK